jgi:hypothetical protein
MQLELLSLNRIVVEKAVDLSEVQIIAADEQFAHLNEGAHNEDAHPNRFRALSTLAVIIAPFS